ncbi:MAG: HAMP domain-containing protein [Acidobacteria bacterium]|nr:HAMP domain-containing protein [Acidobacteriota bacterium]
MTESAAHTGDRKIRRSVKTRILYALVFVFLLGLAAKLVLYHAYLVPRIRSQERAFAVAAAERVQTMLDYTMAEVVSLCRDWSQWDAMYRAVSAWDTDFEKENFPDTIYRTLELNIVVILDASERVVFARKSRVLDGEDCVRPALLSERIRQVLRQSLTSNPEFSAFFMTDDGPLFIAAFPILHSDTTGPPNGCLILGRFVTADILDQLPLGPHDRVTMTSSRTIPAGFEAGDGYHLARSADRLAVLLPVKDFFQQTLALLRVETDRRPLVLLEDALFMSNVITLAVFLLLLMLILLSLRRIALRRIERMSSALNNVTLDRLDANLPPDQDHDEIALLGDTIRDMICRLAEETDTRRRMEAELQAMDKMAAAGKITYAIIHEVNNPVRVIKNCLHAMKKDPSHQGHYLPLLEKEIRHLGHITDRCLDFSQRQEYDFRPGDLRLMVKDALLSVEAAFPKANVTIDSNIPDEPLMVHADAARIKQVLVNLVKNALEAMAFKGRLKVTLLRRADQAVIDLFDDGPGIPPNRVEQIFEPFHSSKNGGMGLGLSLSHTIVRNHGGDLILDPEYHPGAHFIMTLPLHPKGNPHGEK